jgi:deoxyuridine 5'-triphosphate nucleotidohydrolase
MTKVKFMKFSADGSSTSAVRAPTYANEGDAGMDVYSPVDGVIRYGELTVIKCGFAVEIPAGYEIQVRPKSGLALKHGITVVNTPGTIDSGYRGEVCVILTSLKAGTEFLVTAGMKIAQIVLKKHEHIEFELTDSLADSDRGVGGFGSSGK